MNAPAENTESQLNDNQLTGAAYALSMQIHAKVKTHNRLAPTSYNRAVLIGEITELRRQFDALRKQVKGKDNRALLTFQNRICAKLDA